MAVRRRPRFLDDLTEAYSFLSERDPRAADRLLDDVELTIRLLEIFTGLGRRRDELHPGVRSLRLREYPHVLFYRDDGGDVVLLRLLHAARDITRGDIRG